MKRFLFFTGMVAVLFISSASGQSLKAGLNLATMTERNDGYSESGFLPRAMVGIQLNPFTIGKTAIYPELLLTWKGQKYTYNIEVGNYARTSEFEYKFTYFEIPFMARTSLTEGLSLEYGLGAGLRLSGRRTGTTTIIQSFTGGGSNTEVFTEDLKYKDVESGSGTNGSKRPLNSFDVTLNVGLLYQLPIDKMSLGVRYSFGVIDVTKDNFTVKDAEPFFEGTKGIQFSLIYSLK